MSNSFQLIAGLFILVLYSSCCSDNKCPTFSAEERQNWLPQTQDNELIFENSQGKAVSFQVKKVIVPEAYTEHAVGSVLMCKCNDCESEADLRATTTDVDAVPDSLYYISIRSNFQKTEVGSRDLFYQLGDFSGGFRITPYISMNNTEKTMEIEPDSIISNMTLGAYTYPNVIIQTRNMDNTAANFQIQKVYLASGFGIVGFISDGILFYRR